MCAWCYDILDLKYGRVLFRFYCACGKTFVAAAKQGLIKVFETRVQCYQPMPRLTPLTIVELLQSTVIFRKLGIFRFYTIAILSLSHSTPSVTCVEVRTLSQSSARIDICVFATQIHIQRTHQAIRCYTSVICSKHQIRPLIRIAKIHIKKKYMIYIMAVG